MDSRLELHKKLLAIANKNSMKVYFQPPANVNITYPAIIYEYSSPRGQHADDKEYLAFIGYQISVITKEPDTSIVKDIIESIKYASFDNINITNNLYHYVISCYTLL